MSASATQGGHNNHNCTWITHLHGSAGSCKGDDQSQWKRANFWPPATPKLILTKICKGDYVRDTDTTTLQNFYLDRMRGFTSAHARLRAPLFTPLSFSGVLTITYSQDATKDINAKYVKRLYSAQEHAFWGSQNHILTSTPLFPLKLPFPYLEIFGWKTALTLEVLRVNDP